MSARTALFDCPRVVIGERHRVRFRARSRLLKYQVTSFRSFEFNDTGVLFCFSSTLKLASDPLRLWRNSMAGLPGSASEVSLLSQGLHSLSRLETIFRLEMLL